MSKINFQNEKLLIGYYLLFAFAIVLMGTMKPVLNWDMIGYVASAKHFEITNPIELHSFVFSNLKDYVSSDMYFSLTNQSNQYRVDMATNPDLFYQQLPFYEIRLIYTFSVLLISKLGLNIFTSTYVVSLISTVLGIFLLLFAMKDKVHIIFLYILPLFLIFFGILYIAKLSSPDAMVFLSLSIFIYLFSKERITLLLIIIPLFVLVRTDTIIFNFMALTAIFFLYKNYKVGSIISFLVTIALYLFINNLFHNYGWSTIFSITLIERISNPADISLTISAIDYIKAFKIGLIDSLHDRPFLGFISITLSLLVLRKIFPERFSNNKELLTYTIIPILYILIHFILFPVTWNRFFIGFYAMSTIAILLLLSQLIKEHEKSSSL